MKKSYVLGSFIYLSILFWIFGFMIIPNDFTVFSIDLFLAIFWIVYILRLINRKNNETIKENSE